jgi:hypothetical protein
MLIVGIESEEGRQMFDERENDFLRSFEMGAIAMAAGIGRIADDAYSRVVSVDEAAFRFRTVARDLLKDNEDGSPFTVEFVQRMADAGWNANVTLEPFEVWCMRRARPRTTWEKDALNPYYYRMTAVYDGMVDTWDALNKMVKRIVTDPTVRGGELHHLIPDHMFDRTLPGSRKELRWDDFQEVALLVDEDGYPEHTGDDE